jgi:pimeloyl-ACP methyl ester carboxylesterase
MSELFDEIEEVYIETNGIKLHTVLIGSGSPIILLHGFPDFWYGWRDIMLGLKDEFRLVVPDLRGYNLSDKPKGIENYTLELLINDIKGISESLKLGKFYLVGHDWGGPIAWAFAGMFPELLEKLVLINGPHPLVIRDLIAKDDDQRKASSYIFEFLKPDSANKLMDNDFQLLKAVLNMDFQNLAGLLRGSGIDDISEIPKREKSLSKFDEDKYVEAWSQPGAVNAGLDYYRASVTEQLIGNRWNGEINVPTLVIHGMDDVALTPKILNGLEDYVKELKIVVKVEDASHWVMVDAPDIVNSSIKKFISNS